MTKEEFRNFVAIVLRDTWDTERQADRIADQWEKDVLAPTQKSAPSESDLAIALRPEADPRDSSAVRLDLTDVERAELYQALEAEAQAAAE